MQKLTHGILKEVYDKCYKQFTDGIDVNYHANTYVGIHEVTYAETEFAGKYLDTCVRFYKHTGDELMLNNAKKVIDSILKNQTERGAFGGGYEIAEEWRWFGVWNQAITAYGMLSYWEITKDERVLKSVERSIEYMAKCFMNDGIDILDTGNGGSQHLVILTVLPKLYAATKNETVKAFLGYIVNRLKNSDNNFFDVKDVLDLRSKKAIENFCCLLGIMMYGELSGDNSAFKGCKGYWESLKKTQIRETGNGTNAENWIEDGNKPQFLDIELRPNENCVAVGWIELSASLFYKYGDARYIDEIERSIYNHLLGSVDDNCEDFAYYQPNFGKRITRTAQSMYKCCRYRGFSAISFLNDLLYFTDNDTVIPMIYANSEYEENGIKITETTNYPFDDTVNFCVSGRTKLKLRIPYWCDDYLVEINGVKTDVACNNGYIILDGDWDNDDIKLSFNTKLTAKKTAIDGKSYVSFFYGDVVLAADSHFGYNVFDINILSEVDFKRIDNSDYNLEFKANAFVNGTEKEVSIVDYASAGKKGDDEYTIWLCEK